MDLDAEQIEMVDYVRKLAPSEKVHRKGEWNKFFGDVTNRLVLEGIAKHIPKDFAATGPGSYIEGIASEFDALIVKKGTLPAKLTNAFHRSSVLLAIEVKRRGVFYKKEEAEHEMRQHHLRLLKGLEEIPLLYITFHESEKLIYATKSVYGDYAFFMSTGTDYRQIIPGEWKRFVLTVLSILKT